MTKNGGAPIINEYENKKNLSETNRRKLVNFLADMLISRHGLYPKTLDYIMIAKAALALFPIFSVNGTKYGTVSLSDFIHIFASK